MSEQAANPRNRQGETAVLTKDAVKNLMQALQHTNEHMYSCKESYELLDEYVELIATNEEAAMLMPLVKAHIDACPDCGQEFEILLEVLKADTAE